MIVGPREALETRAVSLRDVNWIGDGALASVPPGGIDVMARVRSTRPPLPARLLPHDGGATVVFAAGEFGVAPGQACVFYDDDGDEARVLGGGFIAAVEPARLPVQKAPERSAPARRTPA